MNCQMFSIGCSVHSIEEFVSILKQHNVKSVVDVRSSPFSKHAPQFNSPILSKALKASGIFYLPFGAEFGARRKEPEVYVNGKVSFRRVKELPIFQAGVERIKEGLSRGLTISIMCTEKDPIDCHRFHLVTRGLVEKLGVSVSHIDYSGQLETTQSIEKRMRDFLKLSPSLETINIVMDEIQAEFPGALDQGRIDEITKEKINRLLNESAYESFERRVAYSLQEEGEEND